MPYQRSEVKICFTENGNTNYCGLYKLMNDYQIYSYYTHTVWWV